MFNFNELNIKTYFTDHLTFTFYTIFISSVRYQYNYNITVKRTKNISQMLNF